MTDKQGFKIDNVGNRAIESLAALKWPAESTASRPTAETVCQCAEIFLANIPDESQHKIIVRLNDEARTAIETTSSVVMSNGFMALGDADKVAVRQAVGLYDAWDVANAFDANHDFGILFKLANGAWTQATPDSEEIVQIIVWTIDCLDHSLQRLSARPWDSSATLRVISLMLANEY
jgi:Protein of unknown function (DUF3768)